MTIPITSITTAGAQVPPFQTVLLAVQSLFQGIYGSDIYIAPDSQDGQLIAALATAFDDMNQTVAAVYQAYSPSYAQGTGLSSVVKINGIRRLVATNSTAVGTVVGVAGTLIPAGVVKDVNGNLWNLPVNITIPNTGSISVTVTAQNVGNIQAAVGTITTINTIINGWQSFTNTSAAVPGAPVETDAALRTRQTQSVALSSQDTLSALLGVVQAVAGIERTQVYENDTGTTNALGIPSHSISVVVEGGTVAEVASAIQSKKTPGTGTYGTTSYVVTDSVGIPTTVNYFVMTEVPITVGVTLQALTGFTSTTGALIQSVITAYLNTLGVGEFVMNNKIVPLANLSGDFVVTTTGLPQASLDALSATYNVLGVQISRASPPVNTTVVNALAAGNSSMTVVSPVNLYIGQQLNLELSTGVYTPIFVTAINYATNVLSFVPPIPSGSSVNAGAGIQLITDVQIAFNEGAQGISSNVTITPVTTWVAM